MWMRSCAVCKALLWKLWLCDSVHCRCGWEWKGFPGGRLRMAKVIQFYRPSNFKNDAKIASQERGKVIEFSVPPKKSA